MAQAPLYPQGGHAVHPGRVQLHPQVLYHHNEPVIVVQPPVYQPRASLDDPVPDYMCYSIITTLCCCICLGVAAVYYSSATRSANAAGRRAEAASNSQTALILNHVGLVLGIIFITIYIIQELYFKESHP